MAQLHMNARGIDGPATFAVGETYHGTIGDDTRAGTARDDTFKYGQGGTDTLSGKGGDDVFQMGGALDSTDIIQGGKGFDTIILNGDYSSPHSFSSFGGVEKIVLVHGFDYDLSFGTVQLHHATLIVDAGNLGADDTARLFAGNSGHYDMTGGAGDDDLYGGEDTDVLRGGAGDDHIVGLNGADLEYGGAGDDTFDLSAPPATSGPAHDTIFGFDTHHDLIAINRALLGVNAPVDIGSLSAATFNSDMKEWVDRHALHASHAVLWTPEHGDLGGHTFLIIDNNGKAGYQPNQDYVVELNGGEHLNALHTDNFVVAL